jgi:hypothetical protein
MNYGGLPLNEKISLWRDNVKELEATIGTGRSAPGIVSLRYLEEDLRAAQTAVSTLQTIRGLVDENVHPQFIYESAVGVQLKEIRLALKRVGYQLETLEELFPKEETK